MGTEVKMDLREKITDFCLRRYKLVTVIMVVFALGLGALIPRISVDTDPENMLSKWAGEKLKTKIVRVADRKRVKKASDHYKSHKSELRDVRVLHSKELKLLKRIVELKTAPSMSQSNKQIAP